MKMKETASFHNSLNNIQKKRENLSSRNLKIKPLHFFTCNVLLCTRNIKI
jgi:hypothetical protein